MSKTADKIKFFDEAARRERIAPPPYAQVGRAVRHPTISGCRSAKIQAGGVLADHFHCKLLDKNDDETGDVIDVWPILHLGTNNLDGDVWPDLCTNDIISIFRDLDDFWYTTFVFDDTDECT